MAFLLLSCLQTLLSECLSLGGSHKVIKADLDSDLLSRMYRRANRGSLLQYQLPKAATSSPQACFSLNETAKCRNNCQWDQVKWAMCMRLSITVSCSSWGILGGLIVSKICSQDNQGGWFCNLLVWSTCSSLGCIYLKTHLCPYICGPFEHHTSWLPHLLVEISICIFKMYLFPNLI